MTVPRIKEFAPAKINLSLRVGILGNDGYHPVESLVAFANFGDELYFEPDQKTTLTVQGSFGDGLSSGEDNLVLQAARALAAKLTEDRGVKITLIKNLPLASGLGGGSADAAACLRGLNRLWKSGLSESQLCAIGADLGSDVPACVVSQTLRMGGRGEKIECVADHDVFDAVLFHPGFPVSTAEVFARFDQMPKPDDHVCWQNDLSLAAIQVAPQIADILKTLNELPQSKTVLLCGSGATCLAKFTNLCEAEQAQIYLETYYPDAWVQKVRVGGNPKH